jgi:hypothetical protein
LTGAPDNDDFAAGIGKLLGRANLRLMERFPEAAVPRNGSRLGLKKRAAS